MDKSLEDRTVVGIYDDVDLCKVELFESNMKLALSIVNNYRDSIRIFQPCWDLEDFQQVAYIGLWKAVNNYIPNNNNKFSTFAGTCINNEIRMQMRTLKRKPQNILADSLEADAPGSSDRGKPLKLKDLMIDNHDYIMENAINKAMNETLSILNGKYKTAFELYYFEYKKQREIAKIMGVSRSYVSKILKDCEKKAQHIINKYI